MKKIIIGLLCVLPAMLMASNDTVYVVGGIQHEGLFPTDMSEVPAQPDWAKVTHLSNSYLDLGVAYAGL